MSRKSISNDKYVLVFGVDHTPMGCFFMLYEKAAQGEDPEADDTEGPQIEADELYGLRIHNRKTLERNPALQRYFSSPNIKLYLRSEETIINIGRAVGINCEKEVYELWD